MFGTILYLDLALGLSTAAYAHIQNTQKEALESHGVGSKYVWSYYYHGHKGHGATAIGKYESFSGYTRAGVRAKASLLNIIAGSIERIITFIKY
ncbi:lactococcin 972 family bacteriocin [Staphylococcus aureus]